MGKFLARGWEQERPPLGRDCPALPSPGGGGSPWCRKNWATGSSARTQVGSPHSRACRARRQERVRYRNEGSCLQSTSSTSTASTRHWGDTGAAQMEPPEPNRPPAARPRALTAFCSSESAFLRAPGGRKKATWSLRPHQNRHTRRHACSGRSRRDGELPGPASVTLWETGPDSRRLLCSMRRWQYSKAFSRSRSWGGSRWLAVEAAESTDSVEPSNSDLSSGRGNTSSADGGASRPGA